MCVTGIVGCAGLLPTVEAIKAKKTIALANKETLISGGPAILPLLKEYGVNVIPADSEHSAIFQSLQARAALGGGGVASRLPTWGAYISATNTRDNPPPPQGVPPGGLRKIILTASGGAFRDWAVEDLKKVTVADALKVSPSVHPSVR